VSHSQSSRRNPAPHSGPISPFTRNVRKVIRSIPRGRVATYAQVAALVGSHRAVRGVVWILHSSSDAAKLPWHRVINSRGTISLARGRGFEEQRRRLIAEGVAVSPDGKIDLARFIWEPKKTRSQAFARAAARFLEEL
jgi:methylated-DNA-protein-cysteine methyltransferase related protein